MTRKTVRILISLTIALATIAIGARIYLPIWLTDYVNKVLSSIKGYSGSVDDVDVHLYRGAYTLKGLKILKKDNDIPVPFFAADNMDISIQWGALLHGKVVSNVDFERPELNFAVGKNGAEQTGQEADWTKPLKDLTYDIDINLVTFTDGKLAYRNFSTKPNVDVYINNMKAEIGNLRNVEDKATPLPSPIEVSGDSIGKGKFAMSGKINILKPTPDMDIDMKLEKVNLPAINNYSKAFAAIDFEKGTLDIYSELVVKDNRVSGYVKPLAHDISIVDIRKDENPIRTLWESFVSVLIQVFKNQPKDQFATKVELEGNLDNIKTDTWSALGGILKNAFVKAFTSSTDNNVSFQNPK